ncbi:MAG: hypothetical protein WBP96_11760, partial [Nitrososphaeraceae archaeon]
MKCSNAKVESAKPITLTSSIWDKVSLNSDMISISSSTTLRILVLMDSCHFTTGMLLFRYILRV